MASWSSRATSSASAAAMITGHRLALTTRLLHRAYRAPVMTPRANVLAYRDLSSNAMARRQPWTRVDDVHRAFSTTRNRCSKASRENHRDARDPATAKKDEEPTSYLPSLPTLPTLPRSVPTKQELLATATGFFGRLRVRSKWFLTRSNRPFRADDYSAFFSWIVFGHLIWIIVGTTTFVSLALAAINTISAQEFLAKKVGSYLTKSLGITVVFENAIVPEWKNGCIRFSNVFVSRRPASMALPAGVRQGSLAEATAQAAAKLTPLPLRDATQEGAEDANYTQFDVTIEAVDVTLSFVKWWNGRGLLKDIELKGVRGVVDRTHVHWDQSKPLDPLDYRHKPQYGDFELDSFKLEDLLVTVHQPAGFRPFTASIFSCDLPRLRKRYLFYDFLCANHVSGSYDNSLITLHPKQSFFLPHSDQREARFRMDGIRIDHINEGAEGPLGWITEGTCDIIADLVIPQQIEEPNIAQVISNIAESVTASDDVPTVAAATARSRKGEGASFQSFLSASGENWLQQNIEIDVHFRLNDAKAQVPLFQHDLSSVNAALVRPIVAYINSRKTFIPVHAHISLPCNNFEGSWTWWDCGLQSGVSQALYDGFVESLYERKRQKRRIQAVGFWSLQMVAQLVVVAMRNVVPAAAP
ncbi:mitochondrial distribution and morphology proteins-domain-containing protein [Protomyces lactucae-debilis]|uniref:Mitochondrial distribution and morphology proteins-domain-containing protein n=1 Tax=Protomyces lactucae-debilis TaxID=2754530 RepID=A0A1Y2FY19_PROLT|nr:mitochondrial distribution and morphology proteins-domain-containing protein [Protomyces lactucae-debilis]ORY87565.1 mitochondrial distribution and morphology proteins-domain-containing protein [Protomyces lactucae-debilis]